VNGVQELWRRAGDILRTQVSDGVWQSTFAQVDAQDRHEGELWLQVPNAIVRDKLDIRYRPLVEDAIAEVDPSVTSVVVRVVESVLLTPSPSTPEPSTTLFDDRGEPTAGAAPPADPARAATRYTFDAFVIGQSNRFAHAAALSVAERPGGSYNPLFIYGGAGLGKTHLLRAVEAYVNDVYPQLKVQYVSTETFLNDFVESIKTTTANEFKRRYRQIDVLLVDDIQFIAGRDGLQEEFFHTFNDLYGANRQIVLSSDRQPDAIPTLEDRLRSRFMMGLITDIQPPDLETRMAILRKKADRDGYVLPNDVSEFIASNITNNIRELEGALNRVTAYSNINRQPLTYDLAERVLGEFIADRQPRPITPAVILEATAEMYGFAVEDLKGKSRRRPLVIARQVAMYVTRELTDLSYPAIAREFGGRDHTTVMHACDKISALMKERSQIYDQVTALDKAIRNRA
jgi:chromosomal replication initiator protein